MRRVWTFRVVPGVTEGDRGCSAVVAAGCRGLVRPQGMLTIHFMLAVRHWCVAGPSTDTGRHVINGGYGRTRSVVHLPETGVSAGTPEDAAASF